MLRTCPSCGAERYVRYAKKTKTGLCLSCSQWKRTEWVTRTCLTCDGEFKISVRDAAKPGRGRYCSPACWTQSDKFKEQAKRQSEDRAGRGNPYYKNGRWVNQYRSPKGWTLSAKGETCCRICGSAEWVQLHHAIPRSKYAAGRDELLNGLPLCASCHQRWHKHSLTITRDVFTPEEWEWLSSAELTGERIEAWLDKRYPRREAA